ncbi:MAG: hypothetical protein JW958_13745 [Candidatus Eisenbacteria bacterium]|nr:hypothetical protein [Candidatus Eisenbacteria bacterium]
MAYTYQDLKHMNVAQLREIASGMDHPAVQGFSQLRKDQLIPGICEALGIDMHVQHRVVGLDKATVKARIKALKVKRDEAIRTGDAEQLKFARRRIHRLKRKIHKAMI